MPENKNFDVEERDDEFQVEIISDDRQLLDHYIIAN